MPDRKSVPVIEGLLDTAGEVGLLASACTTCDTIYLPQTSRCHDPLCSGVKVETRLVGQSGVLLSWTRQVYEPPAPFRMDNWSPHLIGLVEVEGGLQVMGMLATDDDAALAYRTSMVLTTRSLYENEDGDDVLTYAYAPASASARTGAAL